MYNSCNYTSILRKEGVFLKKECNVPIIFQVL